MGRGKRWRAGEGRPIQGSAAAVVGTIRVCAEVKQTGDHLRAPRADRAQKRGIAV